MSVTTVNLGKIRINWRGAFVSTTAYTVNDAVSYGGSSYICVIGYTSTSSFPTDLGAGYWQLMAQGNSVNTTAGDLSYRGTGGADVRLPVGSSGQVLTVTPGGLLDWEYPGQGGNDYYVSPNGSDTNDGSTLTRAWRTVRHACDTITGPATLYIKAGTYYEILPITVPPSITIIGDGMRDTIISPLIGLVTTTYTASGSSGTTLKVASTSSIGIGMTVTGTGFTGGQKVIAVVDSVTVTLSAVPNTTPSGTLTFTYLSTDASPVPNQNSTMFLMSNETMMSGLLMIGMTGFAPNGGHPTDFTYATVGGVFLRLNPASPISTKSPYIKDCTAKSSGGVGAIVDGSVHASGNRSMLFWAYNQVHDGGVGLVVCNLGKAEAVSCFTYYCYFGYFTYGGGIIRSLSGNNSYGTYGCVSQGYDSTESPVTGTVYGNMLTFNTVGSTGTFSQGEIITQPYAAAITLASATGTTNTATLNYSAQSSAPYTPGQTIIVSGITPSGYNGTYTVVTSTTTQTTYTVSGASGFGSGTGGTVKGVASAYVTSVQTGYLYYKQTYGAFNTSTLVTGSTSGATMTPTADGGQNNYLLVLSSLTAVPQVGASIQFTSGDTNAYVIQGVSFATVNSVSLTIITLAQQKTVTSADGINIQVRYNFSNIRLTGHDFLNIGSGGIATTNYPGIPSQNPDPAKQTIWTFPGRIYYVATDQAGNFSVGQYFSVNQATGAATLNASAFNLSGLTSLRLGTLGAQLGAQINEFSTDGTLSQNSDVKVPTQHAVTTYLGAAYQNFSPALDTVVTTATASTGTNITVNSTTGMVVNMTVVFGSNMGNIVAGTVYYILTASGTNLTITTVSNGTTPFTVGTTVSQSVAVNCGYSLGDAGHRWSHLYVGPGSITIGSLTISDNAGTLQVQASGANAPANINAIQNGTSNVTVANNGSVTITGGGNLGLTVDSSGNATFAGNVTVNGGTTNLSTTNLNINDALIYMAQSNPANLNDIGLVGHFTSGIYQHTGMVRQASTNTWMFFSGATTEPDTTITTTDGTFVYDPVKMGALTASGNLTVTSATPTLALNNTAPTISTNSSGSTASVFNTNATTVNAFGAATTIAIGASTGTTTINNATVTLANATALNLNGASPGIVTSSTGTAAVFNTNALTGNLFGAATTVSIGAASGTTTIKGNLAVDSGKTFAIKGSSSGSVTFQAASAAGSVTYTLPSADAAVSGYALVSNASGTLSWAAAGATLSDDSSTTTLYPTMSTATTGSLTTAKISSSKFTFNASTGVLTTSGGFVESSSITLKENVMPITNALDVVLQMLGVTYDRKDGSKKNEPGLIAEDVAAIADNLVMRDDNGKPTGIYYSKITAYLVEAIKGLHSQIDPLKEEIRKLKGE